jgi:carbamoylphosphate synthase small subunit
VSRQPALLALAGATFEGYVTGHLAEHGVTTGESVFNTALSGCQEVITDLVQYHRETGPGPHGARYLLERFESLPRRGSLDCA